MALVRAADASEFALVRDLGSRRGELDLIAIAQSGAVLVAEDSERLVAFVLLDERAHISELVAPSAEVAAPLLAAAEQWAIGRSLGTMSAPADTPWLAEHGFVPGPDGLHKKLPREYGQACFPNP